MSLPAGALGLVLLPLTALLGWLFANGAVRRGSFQYLSSLATYSISLCVVSAVFWAWASYKLLAKHDPDLGVVTFLIAFTASYRTADLCSVQVSRGASSKDPTPVRRMEVAQPAALLLVSTVRA